VATPLPPDLIRGAILCCASGGFRAHGHCASKGRVMRAERRQSAHDDTTCTGMSDICIKCSIKTEQQRPYTTVGASAATTRGPRTPVECRQSASCVPPRRPPHPGCSPPHPCPFDGMRTGPFPLPVPNTGPSSASLITCGRRFLPHDVADVARRQAREQLEDDDEDDEVAQGFPPAMSHMREGRGEGTERRWGRPSTPPSHSCNPHRVRSENPPRTHRSP
jgi:hypothetical protein